MPLPVHSQGREPGCCPTGSSATSSEARIAHCASVRSWRTPARRMPSTRVSVVRDFLVVAPSTGDLARFLSTVVGPAVVAARANLPASSDLDVLGYAPVIFNLFVSVFFRVALEWLLLKDILEAMRLRLPVLCYKDVPDVSKGIQHRGAWPGKPHFGSRWAGSRTGRGGGRRTSTSPEGLTPPEDDGFMTALDTYARHPDGESHGHKDRRHDA
jgi:hypothetical protein